MSYRILSLLLASFFLIFAKHARAQQLTLKDSVLKLSTYAEGRVGVSVINFNNDDHISVNGDSHFPMQSVMKFPLAIAILHQVDLGKLTLTQKIHINKNDLAIPAVSPIRDKYPEGNVDLSIAELLSYTVSQSDNNGCDKLFQVLGGPGFVNNYIHSIGIKQIAIVATEKEMGRDWQTQYKNWGTPNAMARLLYLFDKGNILSKQSHDFLWSLMIETVSAPKRLKGLLPASAVVAHKPGTSSVNSKGIAAATNDIGIIELPDKQHVAVAIFVSDAKAVLAMREETIAKITRLIWNSYQTN